MVHIEGDYDCLKNENVLYGFFEGIDYEGGIESFDFEYEDAIKAWEAIKPLRDFIDDLGRAIKESDTL